MVEQDFNERKLGPEFANRIAEGVLEIHGRDGFIRQGERGADGVYQPGRDIHVPSSLIRRFGLKNGDFIKGLTGPSGFEWKLLFSVELELQKGLENGDFSKQLRQQFTNNNILLPQNVTILVDELGDRWDLLNKGGNPLYHIRRECDSLNVYGKGKVYHGFKGIQAVNNDEDPVRYDMMVEGVLEVALEGYGFVRQGERGKADTYEPMKDGFYVSPSQIRKFGLKTGDVIKGKGWPPAPEGVGIRCHVLIHIDKVNNEDPR